MNFPRYKFSKEAEPVLLQFLNIASEQKNINPYCDINTYNNWNKILGLVNSFIYEQKCA